MKRIFDISSSFIGLFIFSPLLLSAMFLVWKEDKKTPFYIAKRVGKHEKVFNMVKLSSNVYLGNVLFYMLYISLIFYNYIIIENYNFKDSI